MMAAWSWADNTDRLARGFSSDFDLDGALDNAATQDIDCAGPPWVGADPPSPATDGINWLADLIAANDAAGCAASADDVNRGTVMDVARFFWTLYSDPGIQMDPTDLSDLYVDTCPLGWSEDDDEWKATRGLDTRPDRRIEAAAAEQSTFEADILTTWGDYVAQ